MISVLLLDPYHRVKKILCALIYVCLLTQIHTIIFLDKIICKDFKTNACNSELIIAAAIGCFVKSIHSYTGACGIHHLIFCGGRSQYILRVSGVEQRSKMKKCLRQTVESKRHVMKTWNYGKLSRSRHFCIASGYGI